jgi:hypothetical protein
MRPARLTKEMHGNAKQAGCDGHPLCFSISSKDIFSSSLNPGMDMTAQHAIFVKTLADAMAEMKDSLARGEVPLIDEKKLELIMTHARYHEQRQAAYQRDAVKFMAAVVSQPSLDKAADVVMKSFRWPEPQRPHGRLVARAILQHETALRSAQHDFHQARLDEAKDAAKRWGAKP